MLSRKLGDNNANDDSEGIIHFITLIIAIKDDIRKFIPDNEKEAS